MILWIKYKKLKKKIAQAEIELNKVQKERFSYSMESRKKEKEMLRTHKLIEEFTKLQRLQIYEEERSRLLAAPSIRSTIKEPI